MRQKNTLLLSDRLISTYFHSFQPSCLVSHQKYHHLPTQTKTYHENILNYRHFPQNRSTCVRDFMMTLEW